MSQITERNAKYRSHGEPVGPRKRLVKRKTQTKPAVVPGKFNPTVRLHPLCAMDPITSLTANYAGLNTSSSVAVATTFSSATATLMPACLNQYPSVPDPGLCNAEQAPDAAYRCSSPPASDRLPTLLIPYKHGAASGASDDDAEMNVDSPDSGFESATPGGCSAADYFGESAKSDTLDEPSKSTVSRTSSLTSDSPEDYRLCLAPPPKPEPPPTPIEQKPVCRWDGCAEEFSTARDLQQHLCDSHVTESLTRFCCLWTGCKVFEKPTRNLSCLEQHVRVHTGVKRFQCWLTGCDASFSSQHGLARHVPSHFSEHHLPKAKLSGQCERRFLVKRRRIRDKRKALANIHDFTDQRTVNVMVTSLVHLDTPSLMSSPVMPTSQAKCIRRSFRDGEKWHLSDTLRWEATPSGQGNEYHQLFFAKPKPRCRKRKAAH